MSIMARLFGGAPAPVAPAQQQNAPVTNNPQNNPQPAATQQTPGTAPNGVVPEQPAPSPLEQFKDVWQPTPIDPNKPTNEPVQFTNEQFMEAAGKVDFTKLISTDQMAKINAGGPEAMQTFIEILNKSNQTVFGQALAGANKIADQKIQEATKNFNSKMSTQIKSQNVKESLFESNPALKDPAIEPLVVAVQQQLTEKFPHATEAELLRKAQEFVLAAGQKFAPPPAKEAPKVPASEDFSDLG